MVVIKKGMYFYIGLKEMKYEKRKKNGIRYFLNISICFNCLFLYCFCIIIGIKYKLYLFIIISMFLIFNLDYLVMSKLLLLCINLMLLFLKYFFIICLIL